MVRQVPFPNPLPKILREQLHLVRLVRSERRSH